MGDNFERESSVESIDRRLRKLLRINLIRSNLRSSIIRALTPKLTAKLSLQSTKGKELESEPSEVSSWVLMPAWFKKALWDKFIEK